MKFTFRNNILNIVVGGIFLLASIIEIIGFFVPEIDYIGKGLKYIIGSFSLIVAGFNLGRHLTKKNKLSENLIWIIGDLIIVIFAILLMFLKQEEKVWLTPSIVVGIDIYLQGVMLILSSTLSNRSVLGSAIIGILLISLGMISFLKLGDQGLKYAFTFAILILGALYLLDGILGLVKDKKSKGSENKSEQKAEEVKESILEDVEETQVSETKEEVKDVESIPYEEDSQIEYEEQEQIGQEDKMLLDHEE